MATESDLEKVAIEEENPKLLAGHDEYLGEPRKIRSATEARVFDVVEFVYDAAPRTVFVLNPNYKLQLHGISLKKMDHHTLVMEVIDKIRTNDTPLAFYNRVIRQPKIIETDAYRTYDIRKMANITTRPYKLL